METFNVQGTCVMCGSATPASYEYHAKGKRGKSAPSISYVGGPPAPKAPLLCPEEGPHMHRTCEQCSYEWAEAPLAQA